MSDGDILARAIEHYAIYLAGNITVEIYAKWRDVENSIGHLVDILNKEKLLSKHINSFGFSYNFEDDIRESFTSFMAKVIKLVRLTIEIKALPPTLIAGVHRLRCMLNHVTENTLLPFLDKHEADFLHKCALNKVCVPPRRELVQMQGMLFGWRACVLEASMKSIDDKRETIRSKSPQNGGRSRDAGLWPLLRAATAVGVANAQLAERLVDLRLDRDPRGSKTKRIDREHKRLNTALSRSPFRPVPVGTKPQ